jgi:hypothetical protein
MAYATVSPKWEAGPISIAKKHALQGLAYQETEPASQRIPDEMPMVA